MGAFLNNYDENIVNVSQQGHLEAKLKLAIDIYNNMSENKISLDRIHDEVSLSRLAGSRITC